MTRLVAFLLGGLLLAASLATYALGGTSAPPAGSHTLIRAQCPDWPQAEGCAYPAQSIVYVSPGLSRVRTRAVFNHELGHLYDWRYLSDRERVEFRRLARLPSSMPWWRTPESGYLAASERFADAYASCTLHYRPQGFWKGVQPRSGKGFAICDFIQETFRGD